MDIGVTQAQPKFKGGDVVGRSLLWASLMPDSDRMCIVLEVGEWRKHPMASHHGWTYMLLRGTEKYVTWEEYLQLL